MKFFELFRRGPDPRPSQADVCGGEAAAVTRLRAGRPDGGRGAGGAFLMSGDFVRRGKSIVFWGIQRLQGWSFGRMLWFRAIFLFLTSLGGQEYPFLVKGSTDSDLLPPTTGIGSPGIEVRC